MAIRGKEAPALLVCGQCMEYVYAGTVQCPHCGRMTALKGTLYCEQGYDALEAMRKIRRLAERAGIVEALPNKR